LAPTTAKLAGITRFNDVWSAGLVLFGLHLLLIGYLAYRSTFVPRILGVLLAIAGLGYLFEASPPCSLPDPRRRSRRSRSSVRSCWRSGASSGADASGSGRRSDPRRLVQQSV
jgi:hypothetical protein